MPSDRDQPARMRGDEVALDVAKGFDAFVPHARALLIEPRTTTIAQMQMQSAMTGSPTQKADIGEPDLSTGTNQVYRDDYATAFTQLGAIDPVYDPEMLALLFEHSNSLRQNIDSYSVNIDGFGHRFDPFFDLSSKGIDQRIGDAIYSDRQRAFDDIGKDEEAPFPTEEEIQTKKGEIEREMRREKVRLQHFFEFVSPDESFVTLRRKTRQDLEVTGNGYWEVLRNNAGQVVHFIYMAAFTMRLLPLDMEATKIQQRVRVSDLSFDDIERVVRMRRYVQVVEGRSVFFKELNDPRVISSVSGVSYPDLQSLAHNEPHARPATEVIHFKIHSPRSPYGVPRWIGNLLAVIGSRQAEEVNFNYFENKSVPPLAILVSGGRMSTGSVERVQDYIEANLKGKRNFHKILVLEADSNSNQTDANSSRMKIQIQPLTGAQHNDALFQVYDERNIDKVGQSFRLSRMLRGDIRDFNRSTSEAALVFAEMQVFEPERQEFDFIINRKVLPLLRVTYWKFLSLAPVMRDPKAMSEILKNLTNANILIPEEARELAGDVFNKEFRRITAKWAQQPTALTIAGVQVEQEGIAPDPTKPSEPTDDPGFSTPGGDIAPDKPVGEGIESIDKRLKGMPAARVKTITDLLAIRKSLRLDEHDRWFKRMLDAAESESKGGLT